MKTLVTDGQGKVEVVETTKPTINPKQALVKTLSGGICGTDLTLIQGSFKGFDNSSYPLMLGHEAVGRVVEIGSEVSSYAVGDIVILPFNPGEGSELSSGWGAFSEYGGIDDKKAYTSTDIPESAFAQQVLPASIKVEEAPILVTLREVYSSILYFGIHKDADVLLYGSGPVAMAFAKLIQLHGVKSVTVVVRNDQKEALMRDLGIHSVINTSKKPLDDVMSEIYPDGVDYVLDAVGHVSILNEGINYLKDRGELLCYGVPKGNILEINYNGAPYNWKLNFQQMPYKDEEANCHQRILDWIAEGEIDMKAFISVTYPFEQIEKAFEEYMNGRTERKVIITYEER